MTQLGLPAKALRAPARATSPVCAPPRHLRASLMALAIQVLLWPMLPAHAQTAAPAGNSEQLPEVKVTAEALRREAGAKVVIAQEEVERTGATGIADVIRYQPLVDAPGTVTGSTRGASRHDRSGTTGYNIRGIEGNRVGLDVDGIEMPDAVSRAPLTNRAQDGSFGMGRDFIDPDIYSAVEIQSGTTNSQRTAGGIGGAVSFRSKSPEDYVSASKPLYLGAKLGYSGANSAWTKGMTAAGLSGDFGALVSYVRRDGKETKNNSLGVPSYPDDWHSDALLLKGSLRVNPEHRLQVGADLYRRGSDTRFEAWNTAATAVTGNSHQLAKTERSTLHAAHTWAPVGGLVDQLNTRIYFQDTEMNDVTHTVALATGANERDISRNTTRQVGFSSVADKRLGNQLLKFGVNYSTADNEHPFSSTDPQAARQPFPDTNTVRLGLFAEDTIEWEVGGRRLALVPGLRVDRVRPRIENAAGFANERITAAELERMYGSTKATTIVSPSLAVLYDVAPTLTAYAQWKRSGRAPTNSEVFGYWNGGGGTYALVGNKDLGKETSNAFDLGLKGSPADGVVFNGSVFHTRYKDFISYTRFTRANNPELFTHIQQSLGILYQANNRDEATISGAEFSARLDHGTWTPAAKGLYSTWAFGYSQGSSKSKLAGDKKVDLDSVQPGKAIIGLGFDAPQKAWGVNLSGTFVKGKQAVSTNRLAFSNDPGATLTDSTTELFRVPGFARFDLAGYYRINPNVRITAGIFNLADKKYWAYSSTRNLQPQSAQDRRQIALSTAPGRTYALSMNVDF
ncbi:MAG: TonB-dependent hemoglobin/transferrin/lactoferrin family receptor [Pseudomonadota bacterium]